MMTKVISILLALSGTLTIYGCPQMAAIEIANITDLQKIGNDPAFPLDGDYVLTADIDASDTATWNGGLGFDPIGPYTDSDPSYAFSGTLDGQGYSISDLTINRTAGSTLVGLFGAITDTGQVTGVYLDGCDITGNTNAIGAIAAFNDGTISGCGAIGTVSGSASGSLVGGLVGISSGSVIQSYSSCTVSGGDRVGGLIGSSLATVSLCAALGNVSGDEYVGGLIGANSLAGSAIDNSCALCDVSGANYVGGLIGQMTGGAASKCYAAGAVSCTGAYHGGLTSNSGTASTIADSYWNVDTTGESGAGWWGGLGKTDAQMKQSFTYVGWDFVSTWVLWVDEIHPAYPIQQWVFGSPTSKAFAATVHTSGLGEITDGASGPGVGVRIGDGAVRCAFVPDTNERLTRALFQFYPSGDTFIRGEEVASSDNAEMFPGQTYTFAPPTGTDTSARIWFEFSPTSALWGASTFGVDAWGGDSASIIGYGVQAPGASASGSFTVTKNMIGDVTFPAAIGRGYPDCPAFSGHGDAPGAAASGSFTVTRNCTGDVTAPGAAASGLGARIRNCDGAVTMPGVAVLSTTTTGHVCTGTPTAPGVAASGEFATGTTEMTGDAAAPGASAGGNFTVTRAGEGEADAPAASALGQGYSISSPKGYPTAPAASASGSFESTSNVRDGTDWAEDLWGYDYWGGNPNLQGCQWEQNAPAAGASGSFSVARDGEGDTTAPASQASGDFVVARYGDGAALAVAMSASGSFWQTTIVTCDGAVTFPAGTAYGEGSATLTAVSASGSATMPGVAASGTFTSTTVVTGSGAVTAPTATASGTGTRQSNGTGATNAAAAAASGSFYRSATFTGNVYTAPAAADGSFSREVTATGAPTAAPAAASGSLSRIVTMTGNVGAPGAGASGTTTKTVTFDGNVSVPGCSATGKTALAMDGQRWYRVTQTRSGGKNEPVRLADLEAVNAPIGITT